MKTSRIFAALLVTALALSCKSNNGIKVDVELPSSADADSVSYLIGVNFGSFLKGNNFCEKLSELNMNQMKKGMEDFLKAEGNMYSPEFGEQFKINPEEMGRILNGYIGKKNEYKAAYNKAAGEQFLAENCKKAEVDTTASGLQYTIHEAGEGERVQPNDTVWVFYSGKTIDGKEFDGNMDSEEPTRFVANRVIKGWTEGLGLLGDGGKATFYIPSELAYGERGNRGIDPNSVLIFEVEIQKVGRVAVETEAEGKKD